jgi:transposase-like protein
MDAKLECPKCSRAVRSKHFKAWKFGPYSVKRYECEHCKLKFNLYQGPKGTYTIPKGE